MPVDFDRIPDCVFELFAEIMSASPELRGRNIKCRNRGDALMIAWGWEPPLLVRYEERLSGYGLGAWAWRKQQKLYPFTDAADRPAPDADRMKANKPGIESETALRLVPGGFSYHGAVHDLTGRPRAMLEALLSAAGRRCTADRLRELLGVDDEKVDHPEQVIRDAAKLLRKALIKAIQEAGLPDQKPLPSVGKGKDLTYRLDIPG